MSLQNSQNPLYRSAGFFDTASILLQDIISGKKV